MVKGRFKAVPGVMIFLMQGNTVLLQLRSKGTWEGGKWCLPGGHLDGNETFRQAAKRELKEEIGIETDLSDFEIVHIVHRKQPSDEKIDIYLKTEKWEGTPKINEPGKHDDLQWFPLDGLPEDLAGHAREAISRISKGQVYSEFGWER